MHVGPNARLKHARIAVLVQAALLGGAAGIASAPDALAQSTDARRPMRIPAGPLQDSLDSLARQAGITLAFDPARLAGRRAPELNGDYTTAEALAALLRPHGLEAVRAATGSFSLRPLQAAASDETALTEVSVTAQREARFGDAPPERGGLAAEHQISATKTPMTLRETPQAISVITRDSIEQRQAKDINSALELAAGVTAAGRAFAGSSPRGGEGFMIRGQAVDFDRDVRIDGFAAASGRSEIDLAPFERVEAIKGPSGMLYGQGSLGGFINLVRKKPRAETSVEAVAQLGSFRTRRIETDLTGSVNTAKTLLGQMAVAYENSGSFIDHVSNERIVVAPSVEALLGERTRALLSVIYQDDKFKPSLGAPLIQEGNRLRPPNIPRSFYFGAPTSDYSTTNGLHTTLRIDHELSDRWLVSLHLHRGRSKLMGLQDSYGYGVGPGGATNLYASWVAHDQESLAGELRLDGKFNAFGRRHRVLLGFEQNKQDYLSWGGYTGPIGAGNIYTGMFASVRARDLPEAYRDLLVVNNQAAYGQVHLSLLDRTKLLLGMRFDRAQQERTGSFSPLAGERKTDAARTHRIGLTQELTPRLTAYAAWAQSFSPVLDLSRNGILDPETGEGYEVGLKGEWFDKRLAANVALFRQELDNRPIPDPTNLPAQSFSISGGLQRATGLELELSGSPARGLTVGFASAWLNAKYIDPTDPNFGLRPDGTVKRQTSLFLNYMLPGNLSNWEVGTTVVSVSDRTVIGGGTNLIIDGYERFDLHARYKGLAGWDVSLLLRNVADKTYIERVNSAFAYAHYFGAPRALLLRAAYKFK